jgi:1-aminocyclopropane-1-carboxylate deaminase
LIEFIKAFKAKHNVQLEPIYNGKMMYGLFDLIKKDYFPSGTYIIALHTGGLQGLQGFSEYFSESEVSH